MMVEIVNTTVCSVSHARAYARTDRSFIVFTVTSVTQPPKSLYFKTLREQISDFNKQKGSQLLFFSLYDSKIRGFCATSPLLFQSFFRLRVNGVTDVTAKKQHF
jgi:hypothetical protein